MLKIFRRLFLLSGILSIYLWAGTTGKISGRVTDATTGEGLPFAVVRILGTQMGAYTDDQGYYVILNVPPGTYELEVTYTGYQPLVIKGVIVEVGRTIEVNFAMKPVEVEVAPIVVIAKEKLIKPDVTESKSTLRSEDIASVPVTTIQQAVSLTAGTIQREGTIYIRGGRPDEVIYVVNGVEIRDPYTNFSRAGVPLIALEEASVERGGFDVDYGTTASGAISLVTKGGDDKYGVEFRSSTTNFSFLGNSVYGVLDNNIGDYYRDFVLGYQKDMKAVGVERHREGEVFHEFAFYGPIFPKRRDWIQFFFAGEYLSDRDRFPASMDGKWRDINYAFTGKVVVPFTRNLRTFLSGFYRFEKQKDWNPEWRLNLDNYYRYEFKEWQVSGGVNWLIADKYMNELRIGYFNRQWKRNVFENVDGDEVDDFDDRDRDGFVEIDLDYLRPVYATRYDTLVQNGDTIIKPVEWEVGDYRKGIDSLLNLLVPPEKREIYRNLVNINEEEGYVELPFYWWEAGIVNFYPSVTSAHPFWPDDPSAPYNISGWGTRVRVNIEVLEVTNGSEVDTVIRMRGKYFDYPFKPELGYLESGVDSLSQLLGPGWVERGILLRLNNQYMPYAYVYPRRQWGVGETGLFTISWRLTSQLVKKTEISPGHEILVGAEYKKMDIKRYSVDFAGGLSNIYFDFVNSPITAREGDPYSFVHWLKDHPVKPWQMAFYVRDKIEMEGMVAKVGLRFDYYESGGYVFTDTSEAFFADTVYREQGIRILNKVEKAKPRWYISPRVGISHPITERDVLHFTYGHYYQIAPFYQMISSYVFSGAFPIVGNAALIPQKTISYELGIKHGFTDDIVLDVTVFYKDIYFWSRALQFGFGFSSYINEDYGYSRGLELSFVKRPGGILLPYLGINLSYTLQFAVGSFSDPEQAYIWQWYGRPLPPWESPLDWDQRHRLNCILSWIVPEKKKFLGVSNWGMTLNYYYGSGFPWSPPFRTGRDAMEKINAERLPAAQNVDMRIYKNFNLGKIGELQIFMDIYNLFNKLNLLSIADGAEEWYHVFGDPEGESKDLSVWSERRQVRVGFFIKLGGF
jgi:outer membrane receptor protein involved in Fe transport